MTFITEIILSNFPFALQLFGFTSLGVVVISTITFIMQTFPEFRLDDDNDDDGDDSADRLATTAIPTEPVEKWHEAIKVLVTIDQLAIVFFTVEYLVRFACSPRKWRFFMAPMNMVDFTAILPFYLTLVLDSMEDLQIIGKAGKLVRLVRVLRIMRIFKLVRHFAGLQSLIYTLNQVPYNLIGKRCSLK